MARSYNFPGRSPIQAAIVGVPQDTPAPAPTANGGPANQSYLATQATVQQAPLVAQTPPPNIPDGRNHRRDQWSGQGTVVGGNIGRMEGFDHNNFNDPNMQTAKYQAGRIFSRYDQNDGDVLQKIMNDPDFRSNFPGARQVGPDKIDFGDGRPVDVIRGHGAPGAAFSWQTQDGPGGAGPGVAGVPVLKKKPDTWFPRTGGWGQGPFSPFPQPDSHPGPWGGPPRGPSPWDPIYTHQVEPQNTGINGGSQDDLLAAYYQYLLEQQGAR